MRPETAGCEIRPSGREVKYDLEGEGTGRPLEAAQPIVSHRSTRSRD